MVEHNRRPGAGKFTWVASWPYLAWFLLGLAMACLFVIILRAVETPASVHLLLSASTVAKATRSVLPFIESYATDERTRAAMTAAALLLVLHCVGYVVLFKPALIRARRFVRDNEVEALDGVLPFALAVALIGVIVLGFLLGDDDVGLFHRTDSDYFGPDGWMIAVVDPPIRWAVVLAIFLGAVPWMCLMFTALLTALGSSGDRDDRKENKP